MTVTFLKLALREKHKFADKSINYSNLAPIAALNRRKLAQTILHLQTSFKKNLPRAIPHSSDNTLPLASRARATVATKNALQSTTNHAAAQLRNRSNRPCRNFPFFPRKEARGEKQESVQRRAFGTLFLRRLISLSSRMPGKVTAKIGPSVLNADLSKLAEESQRLLDCGADYLHLDVMDGHFVPNLSFGHPIVKCLRSKVKDAFFETHMMVSKPEQWIEPMADAGVNQYTFHVEPVEDVPLICRKIREAGMKVGVALKPGTPVDVVTQYIDQADMVLIMTVEPGFGGQKFMDSMMSKVTWLRQNYPDLDIEVDGGVGPSTINTCAEAGANMIVSGTAVINSSEPAKVIKDMRCTVNNALEK